MKTSRSSTASLTVGSVSRFQALAQFVNGFAFKPKHLGEKGLPVVKIPELRMGVSEKTPRNDGELIPEKYHLKDGDLLFSWSGTLAVNVWARWACAVGTNTYSTSYRLVGSDVVS